MDAHLAVVIPAYCEQELLGVTLDRIPGQVDDVVVVDDGSTDATWEVARDFARREERLEVVRLGFNSGVGRAICRGYRKALQLGADVVVVMAADAQMDPADLEDVIAPILEGRADYVKGNRLDHPDVDAMPLIRRTGTDLLARLTGLVSGYSDLRDSQCGYTAVAASLLERLPLGEVFPSYGYPNDLLIRIAEEGGRLAQPPVRPVYEDETSDLDPVRVTIPILGILFRGVLRRLAVSASTG